MGEKKDKKSNESDDGCKKLVKFLGIIGLIFEFCKKNPFSIYPFIVNSAAVQDMLGTKCNNVKIEF